jgi:hypothetical protein
LKIRSEPVAHPARLNMTVRRSYLYVVLPLVLLLVWSCGDDGTSPPADTEAPEVTITSPTSTGVWETGETSLTVSGTASDDVGVSAVTWSAGGESGTANGTTNWSATVPLSDGSNTVTVRARDEAGNEGSATLEVTVDAAGPSVTIEHPTSDEQHLTGTSPVDVSGTASDESGVDRVEWSVEGGTSGTAEGTTEWTITALELAEGENVLTVTAFDAYGNEAAASLTLVLDQTPPVLALSGPAAGGFYTTIEVSLALAGTASDAWGLDRVEWSIAGGASGTASGTDDWLVGALPLALGPNEVTISAIDAVGNVATETLTVVRLEALAALTMNPAVILTNSTREIRVTAALDADFDIGPDGMRLVVVDAAGEVVEELAVLRDSGDLDDGDDILNDGVYSGLVVVLRATPQELRLQAVADVVGGATDQARTPVRALAIHAPTAPEDDQLLDEVQQNAAASLVAMLSQGTELAAAVGALVDEIAGREGVAEVESTGETSITITYESGLVGGLVLARAQGEGATTRGGALAGPARQRSPPATVRTPRAWLVPSDTIVRAKSRTIPLDRQTRGTAPVASPGLAVGAATAPETAILNRRVLIYAPYEAVWDPYNEGPELVAVLEASQLEFDVTYVRDQDATLAHLERLTEYGLVVLATHGSAGRHILTGEVATEEKRDEYDALRQAGQIVVWTYIEIGTDDEGAEEATVREDVFGVTDAFIDALPGTFPQSLIVNNSCDSTLRDDLSDAFLAKGAVTYLGYSAVVSSSFAVDMVLELVEPMVGAGLETVGSAFTAGQIDDKGPWGAEFELRGSETLGYSVEFTNGGFEAGGLSGWTALGDGRIITRLGSLEPVEGKFMAIISTGLGFTTTSGAIYQTLHVPEKATTLRVHWNFLSEEFLEWIGTQFQDRFTVSVIPAGGSAKTLFERTIDDIAAEANCTSEGGSECSLVLVSPEIVFDQGDVYMTGWRTLELNMKSYQGQLITLVFSASDVGDSIYDTAILLDGMVFN